MKTIDFLRRISLSLILRIAHEGFRKETSDHIFSNLSILSIIAVSVLGIYFWLSFSWNFQTNLFKFENTTYAIFLIKPKLSLFLSKALIFHIKKLSEEHQYSLRINSNIKQLVLSNQGKYVQMNCYCWLLKHVGEMRKGNFSGKASSAQNVNGRLAGRRPVRFVRRFELSVAQKADTTNEKPSKEPTKIHHQIKDRLSSNKHVPDKE